ncbi:MAG: hypothetical protein IPK60_22670 [Sandaracinaceae bacterium]|nr:hypothetical protein [Sandaracinaceae bacterium]
MTFLPLSRSRSLRLFVQLVGAMLVVSSCGRLGFQAHPQSEDAGDDASVDMSFDGGAALDAASDSDIIDAAFDLPDEADASDLGTPDSPGILVSPTSGLVTTEMGGIDTFTVVLLAQPTNDVTIGISSSNIAEGTVAPVALVFTAINWNAPQTVTVTGVDDPAADGTSTYTILTAAASSGDVRYAGMEADDVSVSNTDDETPGVTVDPIVGLITSENGGTDTFTVVLNAAPSADVTIALTSSDELEVTISTPSLVFTSSNWSAPQTVTVAGVNDSDIDGDQDFTIYTAHTASTDSAYDGIDAEDVMGRNRDDESAGIVVSPTSGLETSEAGGTAVFSVVLQSAPIADVLVPLSSTDEGEGTLSTDSVVFTSLDWDIPHAVTVIGVDDGVADGNQPYLVHVGPATSADGFYNARTADDVALTNQDDDTPGYTVTQLSALTTTESGGTATFSIVLNARPTANVIFSVTSADASEVSVNNPNPRSTPALWYEPQIVTLTGVNDPVIDGDQVVDVVVHVNLTADAGYMALADTHLSVTNLDDETPGVTVTPTTGLTTSEAGGTSSFTVVLNAQPSASVSVALSSDTPTEGTVSPASLTFTTSNWSTPRTVIVTGANDFVADGARMYTIVTGAVTSADGAYAGINPSDVSVTNTDNDTAGINVAPTSIIAPETGTPATFLVSLRSQPTASVTIPLHMLDTTQGTLSPASLTFTTGNWSVAQTVTAVGINDGVMDGTFINTAFTDAAVSTDMTYSGFDAANVSVIHTEMAGINVTPTAGLTTTEASGTAMFTVSLISMPTANVSIQIQNASEGTPHPTFNSSIFLTFTTVNWNTPQVVTVRGLNDIYDDGDVAYTIPVLPATSADPQYNGIDPPDVSLTNIDDDTASIVVTQVAGSATTENGGTATFRMAFSTLSASFLNLSIVVSDPTEAVIATNNLPGYNNTINGAPTIPFTFTIRGIDDLIIDGDVAYTVNISFTTTDPGYSTVTIPPIPLTNVDNDSMDIIVSPDSPTPVTEQGLTSTAQVVLTRAPSANVVVGISSSDTGEATVTPASLTFTTANWNTPKTVTITGVADGIVDGTQSVTVITAPAVSTDGSFNGMDPQDVTVLNVDANEGRCVSVTPLYLPATGFLGGEATNAVSTDGRYVAFHSFPGTLVAGDTNNTYDAFLRDRVGISTTRASVSSAGVQATNASANAQVSGDGRFVAFYSDANNLVPSDANGQTDAFVRDTMFGTTERVSLSSAGLELSGLSVPTGISSDGRFVAFLTNAAAGPGDTNNQYDIYVRDRTMNTTVRASVDSSGVGGSSGVASGAAISANGRYVVFSTLSSFSPLDVGTGYDVYMRDLIANTTVLVDVAMSGTAAGNAGAVGGVPSSDGHYVVFQSVSSNLVAGDVASSPDIFVRDMIAGTTTRVSIATDGTPANAYASGISISDDGRRVAFVSPATNLVPDDTNGVSDLFVHDLMSGQTLLVSRDPSGLVQAPASSGVIGGWLSGDGHTAVFTTQSASIVHPRFDTNESFDVYAVSVP